ncbi:beta-lactamase/transpeptidase-like protein [Cladochytrium replicatum]|nr:beta-lactamase/transpeptidase-like protein [Cladochytrium replicatum]
MSRSHSQNMLCGKNNGFRLSLIHILVSICVIFSAVGSDATDPRTVLDELELYRQRWNIPGAAVVVVSEFGNKVLLANGLGIRNAKGDPVISTTTFHIGSNSKAMNAFVISRLAEKKILNMTRPIVDYRPALRFNDSTTTQNVNLVDLLSHRTGLPRGDLAIQMFNNSADLFDNRIRYWEPLYKFRNGSAYQNHMHALGGLVASDVYHCHRSNIPNFRSRTSDFQRWYKMMKAEFFDPLKMSRTTADLSRWMVDDSRSDSAMMTIDYTTGLPKPAFGWYDPMAAIVYSWVAPAGSISTNAEDLVKYLKFLLKKGVSEDGRPLLSQEAFNNSFYPHNPYYSTTSAYGLGWNIEKYRGKISYSHRGSTTMSSVVRLFPDDGFGVFVVTNNAADWGTPATNHIVDRDTFRRMLFGDNSTTRFAVAEQTIVATEKAHVSGIAKAYAGLPVPVPLPTVNYTAFYGIYNHGLWGDMVISATNATVPIPSATPIKPLDLEFTKFAYKYFAKLFGLSGPTLTGEAVITHFSGNTFLLLGDPFAGSFTFVTDGSNVRGVRVSVEKMGSDHDSGSWFAKTA